jgi:GNAT superfamily N-acetyltransferase
MNQLIFRNINDSELNQAYSIICETVEWLNSKEIKQWIGPIPIEIYKKRQIKNENYGLFHDGILKVVLSIVFESISMWNDQIGNDKNWWIHTLATSNHYRGKNFGRIGIQKAIKYLLDKSVEVFYLDCIEGNGFLPEFYRKLGFKQILNRKMVIEKGSLPDEFFVPLSNYYNDRMMVLLKWLKDP